MDQQLGRFIMIGGIIIFVVGLLLYMLGDKLSFIGRLPGDIRIEKENVKFYFPLTTMILLSIVINLLWRLLQWLK